MGIAFSKIETMSELGLLKNKMSIMDIGSSNLYSASTEQILALWATFDGGGLVDPEKKNKRAREIAEGSYYDPVLGGRNGAWAGELFEGCGFSYKSLDIAKGYRTALFDLNRESVPPVWHAAFDLVLNFGTTEHVLNQENAFRVIHDLTKINGFIVHELPVGGFADHGYVVYTLRFFMDIAQSNRYKIVALRFCEGNDKDFLQLAREIHSWDALFPRISDPTPVLVKDLALLVVFQKQEEAPFHTCLETTTSVLLER